MAVVKLKLMMITGRSGQADAALSFCTSAPDFLFENAGEVAGYGGALPASVQANPYAALLSRIDTLCKSLNIRISASEKKPPSPMTAEEISGAMAKLDAVTAEHNTLEADMQELRAGILRGEQIREQLEHFRDSDFDFDALNGMEYFRYRFGKMPRDGYENIRIYTEESEDMILIPTSVEKQEVWLMYAAPHKVIPRLDALFHSLRFENIEFSDSVHGTPVQAIDSLTADITEKKAALTESEKKMSTFGREHAEGLVTLGRRVLSLYRESERRSMILFREDDFCIAGWLPAGKVKRFCEKLKKKCDVSCTVEDPSPHGPTPPTVLRNLPPVRAFEDFVSMYGTPAYNELDPTPFVALTYFLFFGMMFGDVGQGAVLTAVGALLWFVFRVSLGRVISLVGISSVLFGFVYGSVFGFEDLLPGLIRPMQNISFVLFAAVGIGVLMIVSVMILNITNGIRQKDPKKFLFSPNGLAGLALYMAAVLIALGMFDVVKTALPTPALIAVLAVALLLIFLADPLTALLKRQRGWKPESKFDFVLENFFELFEVVLSYLTNTISFIRIGAFALSHVGMMTVIFLLAGTQEGVTVGNPVVLILGNLFVIGFEGLIVGIQVLRLEFYELFGRFYEGDGHGPAPLGVTAIGADEPKRKKH